jgi:hypothetical protein
VGGSKGDVICSFLFWWQKANMKHRASAHFLFREKHHNFSEVLDFEQQTVAEGYVLLPRIYLGSTYLLSCIQSLNTRST